MNQTRKKCFIITPIGNTDSDIFRKTKGVIDSVIKPVLQEYGFSDIKPAYEITEQGTIGNQIISRIIGDDLVVANLTGNNPNVMYELAIRHVTAKPIITICENGTILPFDIKDSRTIFYKDDMLGTQELKNAFESFVADIDYSSCYRDNTIYNAVNSFSGISITNEKQNAKLSFSLKTNGERLQDGAYPTKTSPSGYSIKIYNIGEKPFYLETFSLEYAEKTIVDCVLPEETAIAPYENYEYELVWQEYDAILYHCKESRLEKCDVVAYEVGGKKNFRGNRFGFAIFTIGFPCIIKSGIYGGDRTAIKGIKRVSFFPTGRDIPVTPAAYNIISYRFYIPRKHLCALRDTKCPCSV